MFSGFKHLYLERPLAVLHLKATGADPLRDRIVEVAAILCDPGGRVTRRRQRVRPGVPIPAAAAAVHGITDFDVAGAPPFADVAPRLLELLGDADLCGFDMAWLDLPLLLAELDRCGLSLSLIARAVVDASELLVKLRPRTLAAAVAAYLGPERAAEHAAASLGALDDAAAAAAVLDRMVAAHPGLSRHPFDLQRTRGRADGTGRFRAVERQGEWVVVFDFGRHRGRRLAEVAREDEGYLYEMLAIGLADDAREIVRAALGRT